MSQVVECDAGTFTYEDFMKEVDALLIRDIGLTHTCMVDTSTRHLWELGAEPCEVAQDILEAEYGDRAPVLLEYAQLHELV